MKQAALNYTAICRITGCCFLFFCGITAKAQQRGTLEIIKDPRIDTLLARRMQPVKSGVATNNYVSTDGYRVQIFTGSSRAEAYAAQAKFKRLYPELRTYIIYREPNFKVRAGDFRTRLEAAKMMQELKPVFPVLFIISEKINPPKLDQTDD